MAASSCLHALALRPFSTVADPPHLHLHNPGARSLNRQTPPVPREHAAGAKLSLQRRATFYGLMALIPIVALATFEGVLRLSWPGGAAPAFEKISVAGVPYLSASPRVSRRYFGTEAMPPVPPTDLFAAVKPPHGLRIFVLGESSAAGFPYPPNGSFSRAVRDALRDALPGDSVEVVNLGIAATNSYAMLDLSRDVLDQHPDAVLIYSGHNEYYGALGVGSTIGVGSSPTLVRAYLALERLRTVILLRNSLAVVGRRLKSAAVDSSAATFMESVAANQQIEFDGRAYQAGLAQFAGNLSILLNRFRSAGENRSG